MFIDEIDAVMGDTILLLFFHIYNLATNHAIDTCLNEGLLILLCAGSISYTAILANRAVVVYRLCINSNDITAYLTDNLHYLVV